MVTKDKLEILKNIFHSISVLGYETLNRKIIVTMYDSNLNFSTSSEK